MDAGVLHDIGTQQAQWLSVRAGPCRATFAAALLIPGSNRLGHPAL